MTNLKHGGKPLNAMLEYLNSLQERCPSLTNALLTYSRVFSIQDRFAQSFEPDRPAETLAGDSGRPVVPGPMPGLDPDAPRQVLAEVRDVIASASPDRRGEIESARAACERDGMLLRSFAGSIDQLSPTARALFLLALNPFYEKLAREVVPHIEGRPWPYAYCPVCGERPSMAVYEASTGARFVQCRLCRTQWQMGRIRCVLCGCEDLAKLSYLRAENDPAHRADACEACGGYLKAVDERALGSEAVLHIEELVMSALDREAIARGYALR